MKFDSSGERKNVHLRKEDQFSNEIIQLIRSSNSITIVSETPKEIVVRAKKSYESIDKLEPRIHIFRFGQKFRTEDIFHKIFKTIKQGKTKDYSSIISVSGFIFNEHV